MLDQFARQNRWWFDSRAIEADRHLSRIRQAPLRWIPPLPFRFDHDAVYTLRGPRQVGKSTVLKRQIETLIASGWPPRRLLYLDVELAGLEKAADLVAAIRAYLDNERSPLGGSHERVAIFLDEVSRVEQWAGALRGLIDNDELRDTTVVATGSHTRDLREGGERLPGRRGGGRELDLELLPLSFRESVALVEPQLPLPAPLASVDRDAVRAGRRDRDLLRPRMVAFLQRYLESGGFLVALNDYATHGQVRAETFGAFRDAVIGECTRAGLREGYLREVINYFAAHLGQEFAARGIAADTDIGSKDTARHYVDTLMSAYVALVGYRASRLDEPAPAFRAPRKLHPFDPLFWHLIRAWAANDPDPWLGVVANSQQPAEIGHLVESVLAAHLQRAFAGRAFSWRPDQLREIDFAVARAGGGADLVESTYQSRVSGADVRALLAAGGGVVATRDTEGDLASGRVYALPAAELLLLLDAPALGPARL